MNRLTSDREYPYAKSIQVLARKDWVDDPEKEPLGKPGYKLPLCAVICFLPLGLFALLHFMRALSAFGKLFTKIVFNQLRPREDNRNLRAVVNWLKPRIKSKSLIICSESGNTRSQCKNQRHMNYIGSLAIFIGLIMWIIIFYLIRMRLPD